MVTIDDEYLINANESCFTLERKSKVEDTNSKNYGNETRIIEGYYTSITNTLEGYIKTKTRKYIASEKINTLKELKEEIANLQDFVSENFKEELPK